jgi:hypothetical protein
VKPWGRRRGAERRGGRCVDRGVAGGVELEGEGVGVDLDPVVGGEQARRGEQLAVDEGAVGGVIDEGEAVGGDDDVGVVAGDPRRGEHDVVGAALAVADAADVDGRLRE